MTLSSRHRNRPLRRPIGRPAPRDYEEQGNRKKMRRQNVIYVELKCDSANKHTGKKIIAADRDRSNSHRRRHNRLVTSPPLYIFCPPLYTQHSIQNAPRPALY